MTFYVFFDVEGHWRKEQDPDPHPDPDPGPLVRGMDPRIRIRIHTKISWIRNTHVTKYANILLFLERWFAAKNFWLDRA
jgi:hypothetical protein